MGQVVSRSNPVMDTAALFGDAASIKKLSPFHKPSLGYRHEDDQ